MFYLFFVSGMTACLLLCYLGIKKEGACSTTWSNGSDIRNHELDRSKIFIVRSSFHKTRPTTARCLHYTRTASELSQGDSLLLQRLYDVRPFINLEPSKRIYWGGSHNLNASLTNDIYNPKFGSDNELVPMGIASTLLWLLPSPVCMNVLFSWLHRATSSSPEWMKSGGDA